MTVLQILPSLGVGGAERATLDIAATLVKAGHRALVATTGGPRLPQLLESGAEHIPFSANAKNPWAVWQNRLRLIEIARHEKVDIIHARSRAPAWTAYFAARALRLPFVTTFHDVYRGTSAPKKFYNGVMARGDRVIAISGFVAAHIRKTYPERAGNIVTIPRGIDYSVFDPAAITPERKQRFLAAEAVPAGVPLFILPARLSHTKGHEITLRALATLGDRPFRCLMIGPDKGRHGYLDRMKKLRDTLGLTEKVHFVEGVDLPAAYAAADLVLSPSQKAEGFGRVPVEAQAMGKPVIATALGATSETILVGETGWLIPAGDVQALADAILRVLSLSAEQNRSLADKGMAHVRAKFDAKRLCASTLEVYESLMKAQ